MRSLLTHATRKTPKVTSPSEAVSLLKSRQNVYIQSVSAAPHVLIDAMVARKEELYGVKIFQIHTEGEAPYLAPECRDHFEVNALFVGPNMRKAVAEGRAQYVPVFLSEIPNLFRKGRVPLDVALVQVSPPDKHGYCSLGVSVATTVAAVETAKIVIAQVNEHMPRTHGDGVVHVSRFDAIVEHDHPLEEVPVPKLTETQIEIGRNVAGVVDDGATLQMGIGAIPNAVLAELRNHRHLGIHTEMFSDGVVDLVECGAITGLNKAIHRGKIVSGFIAGTKKLYDFVDDNPVVVMRDIAYVNDPDVIRQNPKVTAINSAVEIDLTGQICADSIGSQIISGVGGQMDFIRGASLSEGGKPIIALPSTTKKGESRIVSMLKPGAGVVTTRAHVHWVATEYGIVDLYGMNLKSRAEALISLSHPDHRPHLFEQVAKHFK